MSPRIVWMAAGDPRLREWLPRVARLTSAAFATADRMPGLPPPDGTGDDVARLHAELHAGATVWAALDAAGRLAGALRVHDHPDGSWELHRIAVTPWARGAGVAAALVAAVEARAAERGVGQVRLNAVVERCLPPVYARMGYRVVAVEPSPDKPLSELVMRRAPGAPCTVGQPAEGWVWPRVFRTIAWFVTGDHTVAVFGRHASVRSAAADGGQRLRRLGDVRFAGVDADLSARPAPFPPGVAARLGARAEYLDSDVVAFRAARSGVPGHLMPRTVDQGTFAMWRYAPGRETAALPVTEGARARQGTP